MAPDILKKAEVVEAGRAPIDTEVELRMANEAGWVSKLSILLILISPPVGPPVI